MNTKDEQDIYLQGLIEVMPIKQRRKRLEEGKNRSRSFRHFLCVNGKRIKVCQNIFLTVHGVSAERLKRLKKLLCSNETPVDKRGKHPKGNAISGDVRDLIRDHINLFPVKQSHYSGQDYHYLDARFNVKIMYDLFCSKYPHVKVTYYYYLKFFHENFNLHFGRPQVDTCNICEGLTLKIKSSSLGDAAKRVAVAEKIVHERRAKKFYSALKLSTTECKQRNDLAVVCFDYMQNLHLPLIPVQDSFYLTQLTVSVFCIHDMKSDKSYFYIYPETAAGKSPNEVCSFLSHFIKNYLGSEVTELRLFSDNCPGQNKNHCLIRFCAALVETGRFGKIDQIFPIRGHSFLPCDRDFAIIKRKLKRYDRIYDLHTYTEIIIISSSLKNKFTVHEIYPENNQYFLKNFKSWWPTYYKKNCVSEETQHQARDARVTFSVSKFNHFVHDSTKSGTVNATECINGLVWHSFHIRHATKSKTQAIKFPESPVYKGPLPILENKTQHLKSLLQWIPEEHKPFYQDILNSGNTRQRKQKKP